jgi:hypothetical protein
MKKKIFFSTIGVLVLVAAAFFIFGGSKKSEEDGLPKVKVVKGDIGQSAGGGTIEPENEISVKPVWRMVDLPTPDRESGTAIARGEADPRRWSWPTQSARCSSRKWKWTTSQRASGRIAGEEKLITDTREFRAFRSRVRLKIAEKRVDGERECDRKHRDE